MIIVQLFGGLGNQMFQYAFGRGLEYYLAEPVFFDKHLFDEDARKVAVCGGKIPIRHFDLDIFPNLTISFASLSQIDNALGGSKNAISKGKRALNRWFNWQIPVPKEQDYWITDENAEYDAQNWPVKKQGKYYYHGYWQKERYFSQISDAIRNTFCFPEIQDSFNKKIAQLIQQCPYSVCLHIRRGDYLNFGWELSPEYYRHAIRCIKEKVNNPTFFVFGQDCEDFIKNELNIEQNFVLVQDYNSRSKTDYRDMQLMSMCKHFIIANSSFAWWSAWLGYSSGQIVIAPDPWINNGSDNICEHWMKIPNR